MEKTTLTEEEMLLLREEAEKGHLPFDPDYDEELGMYTMDREEFEKLFHLRGRRTIFKTDDGREVKVGDWVYLEYPEPKHRNETEPDIIEGFYKSYYKETYVVVRVGMRGRMHGKRKTYPLRMFRVMVNKGKIKLLQMPLYQYGDRFKNKYNKEHLVIRDVPRSKNDKEDEFVYYVRTYSLKEGYNYRSMFESEIKEFFHTEGVIKR